MILLFSCGLYAAVMAYIGVDPVMVLSGVALVAAGFFYERLGAILKAIRELKDK